MTCCCSVFPKIAKRFEWWTNMRTEDRVIPHFTTEIGYHAIHFCPSCGADIRGIVISKDEFDKLK
jgi:hypothetical protein